MLSMSNGNRTASNDKVRECYKMAKRAEALGLTGTARELRDLALDYRGLYGRDLWEIMPGDELALDRKMIKAQREINKARRA